MSIDGLELQATALRAQYPDDRLPGSTAEIDPLQAVAGQTRALDAIAFGLDMHADGYNIASSGPQGSGRNTAVRLLVAERAKDKRLADDWVYLHNFADPYRPRAVRLDAAQGDDLQRAMAALIETIESDLPAAFESDSYQERSVELLAPVNARREEALAFLNNAAQELGFAVNATPAGFAPIPLGQDGQPLAAEAFRQLPEATRQEFEQRAKQVQDVIVTAVRELRSIDQDARAAIRARDAEVGRFAIQHNLDELRVAFPGPELAVYIDEVEKDVIANLDVLRRQSGETSAASPPGGPPAGPRPDSRGRVLRRYEVNLFVTHGDEPPDRAPVVEESQPTYYNLFGRLDYETQFGSVTTDFTQIRPGALHMANGGYLVLQAEDLMADPRSWLKLKRSLKDQQVRVEDTSDMGLPLPRLHLVPEPIPLDVKVVLVGSPMTIGMLDVLDPDFAALFKIRAEFEPDTPVEADTIAAYAAFICREADLCSQHFDRSAMREVLRFGNRLATRQDRLSTQYSVIADLCQEAHQLAHNSDAEIVNGKHVRLAVRAMNHRADLVPTRMRRMIAEGSLHIETSGEVVGQVNGLAVYSIGRQSFGTPTRITCRVGAGTLGVVNIERETERSGAIHTKGVLVLSGFLMGTFGRDDPLSFSGSVTFEQSYDEVDGDSASSAELYSILTALADVPMRQELAVTGSVDQFGNVQPVGGVTHKVEGFFDVCREIGLTGTQGVIIPQSNVVNLTLRDDVVDAVEEGRFHIWAVSRIEQGLELLTGVPPGDSDADGQFAEGTIFAKVAAALRGMRSAPGALPRLASRPAIPWVTSIAPRIPCVPPRRCARSSVLRDGSLACGAESAAMSELHTPGDFFVDGTPHITPHHVLDLRARRLGADRDDLRLPPTFIATFFRDTANELALATGIDPGSIQGDSDFWKVSANEHLAVGRMPIGAPFAVSFFEQIVASGAERVIVIGAAGSLQPEIDIPADTIREEGTSYHYLPADEAARADPGLADQLHAAAVALSAAETPAPHRGLHWTTDAIFREQQVPSSGYDQAPAARASSTR